MKFFDHHVDPHLSDKAQRIGCPRPLHRNEWKRVQANPPSQADIYREIREGAYDGLGCILQQSFSQLYAQMTDEEKWLLFQSFTENNEAAIEEVLRPIKLKSELEEAQCLYELKKAICQILKDLDRPVLTSIKVTGLAMECDQLTVSRDIQREVQTTAVCLQYFLTATCGYELSDQQWTQTEGICLTWGMYLYQERQLAPRIAAGSESFISRPSESQTTDSRSNLPAESSSTNLTADRVKLFVMEQAMQSGRGYEATTEGEVTPKSSTIGSEPLSERCETLQTDCGAGPFNNESNFVSK